MTTSPIIRRHPRANGGHAGKVGGKAGGALSAIYPPPAELITTNRTREMDETSWVIDGDDQE